jgi:hypothetical protein
MIRAILAALVCLFIAGCAGAPPKIVTQPVAYQVPIARACPEALCAPVHYGPLPAFKPGEGDTVILDAEGQKRLRDLLTLLRGRDEAWRSWATSP